ncbi:hypothetical protein CON39_10390 [Bacillus thuringiensis]|nr:hypothetical protein BK789_18605 [Bacillus thuringiensis serovar darmstadiensis]PEF30573.1 hypothetical protein CON39_10390 [Bacillus thuringiensis]
MLSIREHAFFCGIDMYNNTKKSCRKIYRKNDKDSAYSEEFLLVSTKVLTRKSVMSKIKKRIKNFQKI